MTQMMCVQCQVRTRSLNFFVKSILDFKSLNLYIYINSIYINNVPFDIKSNIRELRTKSILTEVMLFEVTE
jgi:hypothetical protein